MQTSSSYCAHRKEITESDARIARLTSRERPSPSVTYAGNGSAPADPRSSPPAGDCPGRARAARFRREPPRPRECRGRNGRPDCDGGKTPAGCPGPDDPAPPHIVQPGNVASRKNCRARGTSNSEPPLHPRQAAPRSPDSDTPPVRRAAPHPTIPWTRSRPRSERTENWRKQALRPRLALPTTELSAVVGSSKQRRRKAVPDPVSISQRIQQNSRTHVLEVIHHNARGSCYA